jgi:hypothetical protein
MVQARLDLWPEMPPVRTGTPVAIMRQQASQLGPKTQNVVEAEVETHAWSHDNTFHHDLVLLAPSLGSYRYKLFQATHGIDFYPVTIVFQGSKQVAENEESFIAGVEGILKHEHTRKVIDALLSQSVS